MCTFMELNFILLKYFCFILLERQKLHRRNGKERSFVCGFTSQTASMIGAGPIPSPGPGYSSGFLTWVVGPKHLDPIFVKFLKLIYNTNWPLLDDFIVVSLLGHTGFSLPSLLTTSRVVLASHMGAGSSLSSSALNAAPCLSTGKVFWPLHHMGDQEEVWDSSFRLVQHWTSRWKIVAGSFSI